MKTKLIVQESTVEPLIIAELCVSCGHALAGKFCSGCGEKKVSARDFSIKHFMEESVEGFTHFDTKLFRSIRTLFGKPGMLTRYYEKGQRVRYMKPVQLFIISNIVFFVLSGGLNLFAISLNNYMGYNGLHDAFIRKFGMHANVAQMAGVFNEKVLSQSKTFIFLFIPCFATVFALLFLKKRKPFTLHLVFATHFFSFLLFNFILFHFLIELPNNYFLHLSANAFEIVALSINLTALVAYNAIATRNYYHASWIWSTLTSLIVAFLFIVLLVWYRTFIFYKILYTIN